MRDEDLARLLLQHVVGDSMRFYGRQVRKPLTDDVTDPLWRALQDWVPGLPEDRQNLILAFARQSAIDAVSAVLGALDGTSPLPDAAGDFKLLYGKSTKALNGDLQDYFLAAVEESADVWLRKATRKGRRR